jgi:ParB family chromosome partitioning protein
MSVINVKAKIPAKTSKKTVELSESTALKATLEVVQIEMVPLSVLLFD